MQPEFSKPPDTTGGKAPDMSGKVPEPEAPVVYSVVQTDTKTGMKTATSEIVMTLTLQVASKVLMNITRLGSRLKGLRYSVWYC